MSKILFNELPLSPEILKAVAKMGFEEATPIQSAALPIILEGRDVVGQSQTGSGKTAAFAIPAIEKVDPHNRAPQVLILCPARELALQVAEEVGKLSQFKRGVHSVPIYGGQSYDRQIRGLKDGAQIVIGTPGRVMDHIERKTLKLDQLKMVILDEADRMLDMGFRDDIDFILSRAPKDRQLIFFSATMPRPIQELIRKFSQDPQTLKIEQKTLTATNVDQVYYEVMRRSKIEVLTRLIDLQDIKLGIIFCSTKLMVDELNDHLVARGYRSDKLHGDMSQALRERVMNKFRKGGIEFLVATDVAARGIDVDDIEVVFNYDLPNDGEDYVHRIGRTGRAGKSGRAITFVSGRDIYRLQDFARYTKMKIRHEKVPSLEEVEEKRADTVFEKLRETLNAASFKKQDERVDRLLDQGYPSTDIASALMHLLLGGSRQGEEVIEEPPRRGREREYGGDRFSKGTDRRERPARFEKERRERPARSSANRDPEAHESGMTRIMLNVGHQQGVTPSDIVGKIAGLARLPASVVGKINIQETHLFVDVAEDCANSVMKKLSGVRVKNIPLQPQIATDGRS